MKYKVKWKRTFWYEANIDVEPDELEPGVSPEQAAVDYSGDFEDDPACQIDDRTVIISVKKVE